MKLFILVVYQLKIKRFCYFSVIFYDQKQECQLSTLANNHFKDIKNRLFHELMRWSSRKIYNKIVFSLILIFNTIFVYKNYFQDLLCCIIHTNSFVNNNLIYGLLTRMLFVCVIWRSKVWTAMFRLLLLLFIRIRIKPGI